MRDIPDKPEKNLYICTKEEDRIWKEEWTKESSSVIATDGAVKQTGTRTFELSGMVVFARGRIQKIQSQVLGTGSSAYNAEVHGIKDALETALESDDKDITIITDCMSILKKLQKWDGWDSHIEISILKILYRLSKMGKTLRLKWVRSHTDCGVNCVVDEIITASWEKNKEQINTLNIPPSSKSHSEVKNIVKKRMQEDETSTRNTLKEDHNSESSKNIHQLNLSRGKVKEWVKKIGKDRQTQDIVINSITDTAFRICGDRLQCPPLFWYRPEPIPYNV